MKIYSDKALFLPAKPSSTVELQENVYIFAPTNNLQFDAPIKLHNFLQNLKPVCFVIFELNP